MRGINPCALVAISCLCLRDGTLVELLPTLGGASRPFSLIYPGNRHMPLRVRVLIDFLLSHLAR